MKKTTKAKLIDIFFILITIILFLATVLPRNLENLDEIWNFNFARNIANGLLPYKDFNMLQTPLLSFFVGAILKIFGQELFVMRIASAFLGAGIIFVSYKILKTLKLNTKWSIFASLLIFLFIKDKFYLDYNYAILFVTLLIIYLELKYKGYNKKYNFLIGLLAGTTILLKQSAGLCITAITIFYLILERRDKETVKLVLYRLLGAIIPAILFIAYLLITNSITGFIDYCIQGIGTFNNSISYLKLLKNKGMISFLAIFVPITLIILLVKNIMNIKDRKINENYLILFVFSFAQFILIYPIADDIHFIVSVIPTVIVMLYFIIMNIQEVKNIKISIFIEHFMNIITISFIGILLLQAVNDGYLYIEQEKSVLKHFKNIPITESLQNRILEVDKFITDMKQQNINVYILDSEAAVYMIPLDRYNKDFDMFLEGNLGAKGEEGQIEKIQEMQKDNAETEQEKNLILIKNETMQLNWQTPKKVINYVRENLEKIGTISFFEIFET